MPNVVSFSDGSSVTYLYAADGTKLRTLHNINGATTQKDYCGSVIYENGAAKLWQTEAGYISMNDSKYHYYLQDHQGNNRVVVNETGATEEVNHYYAFGGLFSSDESVQPFKYNGKELDTKKGLNWYDYGARQYDASLGRFITQDRFTEKYSALSPYQYGANNPACNMDVNGDSIVVLKDKLHLGLLIQNENNKWAYYSFNGVKAYESTNEKFGAPRDNKGEMIWNTPQEFLDSDYNNLNEEGNNGYGYQEGFLIPTNSEQDNIVKETFLQAVGQGYSLINNHCSIAVQKSLKAIGLKTRFKIGYLPFVVSPISTIRINRDPYLPNEAYIVIKMKNRGYVIKRNDNEY